MNILKCLHGDGVNLKVGELYVEESEGTLICPGHYDAELLYECEADIKGWGKLDGPAVSLKPDGAAWSVIVPLSEFERIDFDPKWLRLAGESMSKKTISTQEILKNLQESFRDSPVSFRSLKDHFVVQARGGETLYYDHDGYLSIQTVSGDYQLQQMLEKMKSLQLLCDVALHIKNLTKSA